MLASLAAVTEHLGLAGTINATFNEPYELARQLASLDHLSGGRAAWNIVTSFDAFTGQNFRRGGFLDRSQRYERAAESLALVRELWDSWAADEIVADKATGQFVRVRRRRRVPALRVASSTCAAGSRVPRIAAGPAR